VTGPKDGSDGPDLNQLCPGCEAEIRATFQFCPSCGRALQDPAAAQPGPQGIRRRRTTALFAYLVDYPALAERMDPEPLHVLVDPLLGELSEVVEAEGGRVERVVPDSILATFGGRRANEDDPRRAVDAALRMMRSAQARSEESSTPLRLRIGINSGLIVFAAVADDL
jgi:class 3 adenylate cyclase